MATDWTKLIEERSLPVSFRGYDRDKTDEFLEALRAGLRTLLDERAAAEARVAELEAQLADARWHESEITEALVVAANVRAESERAAEELTTRSERRGKSIEEEADRKAEAVVSDAWAEADEILEEAKQKAREIEEATQLADDTRDRVASFLETILDEVRRPRRELSSTDDAQLLVNGGVAEDDARNAQVVGDTKPGSTSR